MLSISGTKTVYMGLNKINYIDAHVQCNDVCHVQHVFVIFLQQEAHNYYYLYIYQALHT